MNDGGSRMHKRVDLAGKSLEVSRIPEYLNNFISRSLGYLAWGRHNYRKRIASRVMPHVGEYMRAASEVEETFAGFRSTDLDKLRLSDRQRLRAALESLSAEENVLIQEGHSLEIGNAGDRELAAMLLDLTRDYDHRRHQRNN